MTVLATVSHLNTLSTFLSSYSPPPPPNTPNCTFILAGNAILPTISNLFNYLLTLSSSTPTVLLIAGGIGHSTSLLYDAIRLHPTYASVFPDIDGLPEARVIEVLLRRFWPVLADRVESGELRLLAEDKSTNCGENAEFSLSLLADRAIRPETIVLVQDPIMSIRTAAGIRKSFTGRLITWPTFIPTLASYSPFVWSDDTLGHIQIRREGSDEETGMGAASLWEKQRFIDLILGEIPRLKMYGPEPEGKGSIAAVEVPEVVMVADRALRERFSGSR